MSERGPAEADDLPARLVHQALGASARIRWLREVTDPHVPLFVVDLDDGPKHQRLLGTLRPASAHGTDAAPEPVAFSAMDLIHPARLVLDYEQLMALALALCDRPASVLMLGLGGAAMWRFVRAHIPECAATLVERDQDIAAIARRWFYLNEPVVIDTAEHFLACTTNRFDAILVDLYDTSGPAALGPEFWGRCLAALAPGGCLATNWHDDSPKVKSMAEAQTAAARARGHDCFFITRRGLRDNIVQYLPTGAVRSLERINGAVERFVADRRLPEGTRGLLNDCIISSTFPVTA
jgi:hypothetical protein